MDEVRPPRDRLAVVDKAARLAAVSPNATRLLPSSAGDRHTPFQILAQAVHHWESPFGQPEFKVVLLCDRDDEAAL
ncbi:hypothetical protein [Micromonospora ureilytica]|uniref:Uncharacterized protein n=1 Tax=Micromonospora ureilytica TaxID=709868 RepID=A0ABS0JCD3_9ACTN|nr:hypothetical protein [Micromonospora ureilytica]MBG6064722.1 hypothetical protein [Micromonospora ureilytica]